MELLLECITAFTTNSYKRRGVPGKPHKPLFQDRAVPRPYLSVQDMVLYVLKHNPPSPTSFDLWWREYVDWYSKFLVLYYLSRAKRLFSPTQ